MLSFIRIYLCLSSISLQFILSSITSVGGRSEVGKRVEKPHRTSRYHEHFSNSKKPEADSNTYNSRGPLAYEEKSRRGNSADKVLSFIS